MEGRRSLTPAQREAAEYEKRLRAEAESLARIQAESGGLAGLIDPDVTADLARIDKQLTFLGLVREVNAMPLFPATDQ